MNTLQALVIAIIEGLTDFYLFLQRLTWVSLQRCWGWKKQSFKDVSGFNSIWCHPSYCSVVLEEIL
jgi:hypothetical protein